jgi:hypothetical protein
MGIDHTRDKAVWQLIGRGRDRLPDAVNVRFLRLAIDTYSSQAVRPPEPHHRPDLRQFRLLGVAAQLLHLQNASTFRNA